MDRRKFLGSLIGSSAVGWIVSQVPPAEAAPQSPYTNPVPLFPSSASAGLNDADLAALFAVNASATPEQQAQTFPQSVAAGDPSVNGVVLWTRVDPVFQTAGYQLAW